MSGIRLSVGCEVSLDGRMGKQDFVRGGWLSWDGRDGWTRLGEGS